MTRSGVFDYADENGNLVREYRPPDEVFHPDSIASFAMVPVTDAHPNQFLNSENAKEHQRGWVGENLVRDGDYMRGTIMITDKALIDKVTHKKNPVTELSFGYTADLFMTPGVTPDGQKYDAIQRNIRGNHIAVVDRGRAGPEARLRVDARTQIFDGTTNPGGAGPQENNGEENMATVKTDEDRNDELVELKAEKKALAKELDSLRAKCDAQGEELKKQIEDAKHAPAKIREEIKARMELEAAATGVLGAIKADASNRELKVSVVAHVRPTFKADGRSDEYIDSAYDLAIEVLAEKKKADAAATGSLSEARGVAIVGQVQLNDADTAREAMISENRNAWKKLSAALK